MATLAKEPYTGNINLRDYSDKGTEAAKGMFAALEQNSLKIDCENSKANLTGALLKFQVADGYAYYIVICNKPLTIAHISIFDGYSIPPAHVRGLLRKDVLAQLKQAKWFNSLPRVKPGH